MRSLILWIQSVLDRLLERSAPTRPRKGSSKPSLQSRPAGSSDTGAPAESAPAPQRMPNLDSERVLAAPVHESERELVDRIAALIEAGEFELPQLPATTMALANLAGKPGVDVTRVVELISSDPTLASELLRVSNSVLYATHVPAGTLNEAVMRIGLKGLRTLIFSVSVKGTILRLKSLSAYSEEVWRQAFSVASIARSIAPILGVERERAFLIGLLHDVGKIALLAMLSKEMAKGQAVSPATIGRVFYVHHERAGQKLAEKWRLDEELASIAGNHHRFLSNAEHGQSAALASLAHKLDLHLSFDDDVSYRGLLHADEFDYLGLPQSRRQAVLDHAQRTRDEGQQEALNEAA